MLYTTYYCIYVSIMYFPQIIFHAFERNIFVLTLAPAKWRQTPKNNTRRLEYSVIRFPRATLYYYSMYGYIYRGESTVYYFTSYGLILLYIDSRTYGALVRV